MSLDLYDEAYSTIHMGIINKNIDVFKVRFCFRGRVDYNLNILQVA